MTLQITDQCKRNQYNINTYVKTQHNRPALATGWGDNSNGLVEVRLIENGTIELHPLHSLTVLEGDLVI
jgi:hypothetical protein